VLAASCDTPTEGSHCARRTDANATIAAATRVAERFCVAYDAHAEQWVLRAKRTCRPRQVRSCTATSRTVHTSGR
jgi:hypothetical protein